MCSARRLMVFNVCVKFHENMSSGFKVIERTRKLLKIVNTQRAITPKVGNQSYGSCVLHVASWCLMFV